MSGKLSYEKAGVSISGGDAWVETIKELLKKRPKDENSVGGVGGFAGLYRIGGGQCIAACCDGVGTKLELAKETSIYRGLGQDLVAMNVNDLVTGGARPLFFLDYAACGKLDVPVLKEIVEGVLDACEESLCALLGGETAEMPGVYGADGFDLAGFSVGLVDEDKIIDGSAIKDQDIIIGLASSGVHSNGYSLVRSVLREAHMDLGASFPRLDAPLGDVLLRPTRLYVRQALQACATGKIKGMAHITGGGLEENIQRVLGGAHPVLHFDAWQRPAIFDVLQQGGDIPENEMRRVFNLGLGFVFVIAPEDEGAVVDLLRDLGERPVVAGEVRA